MSTYEEDLDLRPYLVALSKHWKIAVFLAIITGVIGLAISFSRPQEYLSTATVIVIHNQLRLSLAEQFPTINENRDTKSRMDAYLTIAQSDFIAQSTSQTHGSTLPPKYQNPDALKALVDVATKGYAITIAANTTDPDLSAEIANTWAEETTKAINQAYSGDQPLGEIQKQIIQAQEEYQESQDDLENFIKGSTSTILEKKIAESQALLDAQVADRAWLYYYYFNRKQYLEDLILQLSALKDQLDSGSSSAAGDLGDALAVLSVRMNSLGINQNAGSASVIVTNPDQSSENINSSSIEFNPAGVRNQPSYIYQLPELDTLLEPNTNYAADIDQLLELAGVEQKRVNDELQKLTSQEFLENADPNLDNLASQIQALKSQLEFERAQRVELTSKRDLSLSTMDALMEKEKELQTAAQASNEVAVASPAVPSHTSNPRGIVIDTLFAAAAGFFLGIFWIVISQWWLMVGSGRSSIATTPVND